MRAWMLPCLVLACSSVTAGALRDFQRFLDRDPNYPARLMNWPIGCDLDPAAVLEVRALIKILRALPSTFLVLMRRRLI